MHIWDMYAQIGAREWEESSERGREIHAYLGRACAFRARVGKKGLNKKSNFSLVKNSAYRTMG